MVNATPKIYSVSELNNYVKSILDNNENLKYLFVEVIKHFVFLRLMMGTRLYPQNTVSGYVRQPHAVSGNWVVATLTERIAAQDPAECQPTALQRTVFFQRFQCILRAGGRKPAAGRTVGRYSGSVEPDKCH